MKIFCVGLYRTGTSSLALALSQLGYRVVHHNRFVQMVEKMNRDRGRPLLWGMEQYESVLDGLLMYAYSELDRQYPGSRFLCTFRDRGSWITSIQKRISDETTRHVNQLGTRTREEWLTHFDEHYSKVERYFSGRNDLLRLNVCAGCGWEPLCNFLDQPIPDSPFPHENKTAGYGAVAPFWNAITAPQPPPAV